MFAILLFCCLKSYMIGYPNKHIGHLCRFPMQRRRNRRKHYQGKVLFLKTLMHHQLMLENKESMFKGTIIITRTNHLGQKDKTAFPKHKKHGRMECQIPKCLVVMSGLVLLLTER